MNIFERAAARVRRLHRLADHGDRVPRHLAPQAYQRVEELYDEHVLFRQELGDSRDQAISLAEPERRVMNTAQSIFLNGHPLDQIGTVVGDAYIESYCCIPRRS